MDRKEVLDILTTFNEQLNKMTEEELYNHMMETSPSFRKTVSDLDKLIATEEGTSTSIIGDSVAIADTVTSKQEYILEEIKDLADSIKAEVGLESTSVRAYYSVPGVKNKGFYIPRKPGKGDKLWAMVA